MTLTLYSMIDMFDFHPPIQIDDNNGGKFITGMLMQLYVEEVVSGFA
jgi:hypothetical protein